MTEAENQALIRVHDRLDDLVDTNDKIIETTARIENRLNLIDQRCEPCRQTVASHQATLHGNGKNGLVERMGAAETGRMDTLSIKSTVTLIAAIGALAATIGGAMAVLVK